LGDERAAKEVDRGSMLKIDEPLIPQLRCAPGLRLAWRRIPGAAIALR
jgi:hypothetical protein